MLQNGAMKPKMKKQYLRGAGLLEQAAKEKPVLRARDFLAAVDLLRQKGFSWRHCSEWLKKHAGVEIHHTQLMRISEDRVIIEQHEDEEG